MATYSYTPVYDGYTYDEYGNQIGGGNIIGYSVNGEGNYATVEDANRKIEELTYNDTLAAAGLSGVQSKYIVNPYNTDAQSGVSDLIESRYDFLKEKSAPLESALFGYSQYDNPELYNDYVSSAIPKVQQNMQQERQAIDRTLSATGGEFDAQQSVLRDKLFNLQSQESITQAANEIRNRLRDREQQIAFGSAPATTNMQGGI